ncbi:hypothetical protein HMI54_001345, partial [Coelomomyces lativittatus]
NPENDKKVLLFFSFQRERFFFDEEKKRFDILPYPIDQCLNHYVTKKGLSGDEVISSEKLYGLNVFDIPVPSFINLFKEHAVAPFFVFQECSFFSNSQLWLKD